MTTGNASADILFRMSLVEGFTARHLAVLGGRREYPRDARSDGSSSRGSLLERGADAAVSAEMQEKADRVRAECSRIGARIVTLGAEGYPDLLAFVPDAPLALYMWGTAPAGRRPVAVVGSRSPTSAGREFARGLSADLAFQGIPVVSGMARGIDTAAHEGALAAGGQTAAVLGCGVDVLYPPEAGPLREAILRTGALFSEYPPGTPPLPHRFPARNRIISGMAKAVIVAEAPERSGALITAKFALEQGREVMAVPGSPLFPHSRGSNRLLREGAAVVTEAEDVIDALGWSKGPSFASRNEVGESAGGELERRILTYLSVERHVNEIAASLEVPVRDLLPRLLEMELRKLLERRRGDYYKKMSKSGSSARNGA